MPLIKSHVLLYRVAEVKRTSGGGHSLQPAAGTGPQYHGHQDWTSCEEQVNFTGTIVLTFSK